MRGSYHLVHLFPHQGQEVKKVVRNYPVPDSITTEFFSDATTIGLPGLFTSVANMCFMPDGLTRPTDADSLLRQVLWARALYLYGTDFVSPLLQPAALALPKEPLPGLWKDDNHNRYFGAPLPAASWQRIQDGCRQRFRDELEEWKAAQPTCL